MASSHTEDWVGMLGAPFRRVGRRVRDLLSLSLAGEWRRARKETLAQVRPLPGDFTTLHSLLLKPVPN